MYYVRVVFEFYGLAGIQSSSPSSAMEALLFSFFNYSSWPPHTHTRSQSILPLALAPALSLQSGEEGGGSVYAGTHDLCNIKRQALWHKAQ